MTDAEYAVVLLRDLPEAPPERMILQSFRRLVQARARANSANPGWLMATINMQDVERMKGPFRDAAWERARKAVSRIALGLPPVKVD